VLAPDGSDSAATQFSISLGHDPRGTAEAAGRDCGLALKPRVVKWLVL